MISIARAALCRCARRDGLGFQVPAGACLQLAFEAAQRLAQRLRRAQQPLPAVIFLIIGLSNPHGCPHDKNGPHHRGYIRVAAPQQLTPRCYKYDDRSNDGGMLHILPRDGVATLPLEERQLVGLLAWCQWMCSILDSTSVLWVQQSDQDICACFLLTLRLPFLHAGHAISSHECP